MNRKLRRARDQSPPPPPPDALLGEALQAHRAGEWARAEPLYRRVLAADPGHATALHYLGVLAHQTGHHEAAATLIAQAVGRAPRDAEAHLNLGTVLHALGRLDEAAAAFGGALALRPDYAQAHFNRGTTLRALGRLDEAVAAFGRAATLQPDHAEALANLGAALQALEQPEAAEPWLERALGLKPGDPDILSNLAAVWESLGRLAEAADLYHRLLAARPDQPETAYNLGNVLRGLGDGAGAEAAYRRALDLDATHAAARWNLGLLRLERHGPGAEAWAAHAARLTSPAIQPSRRPPLPEWRGESLAGTRLLVWREQGLGDELMFAALYPDLLARAEAEGGAVVIECDARLVGLFARAFPGAQVRAETSDDAPPDADRHVAAGSLARWLRPDLSGFRAARPGWLVPDPDRVARWRDRLAALGPAPKVGLGWRSGLATRRRAGCYAPLAGWGPILTTPGLAFVSLQYDRAEAALQDAEARFGVTVQRFADIDLKNDLEEAAALTAALDLVIAAPTAVGEMAGALGVPAWRIQPGGDWSVLGTAVRPWYPAMRLFQPRPGESLEHALARAGAALAEFRETRMNTDKH